MKEKIVEVSIKNLRLRTIIGVHEWERKNLQDVIISITYQYNAAEAIQNDDFQKALDYKGLTKKIIKEVENSKFELVESLADMVYHTVRENEMIKNLDVVVEKPGSLRFCDTVSIRISDNER